MWRNDNTEPFGDSVPNGDPNNTGNVFDFPLRLSNYYADRETGTLYAMYRDAYDTGLGRFPQGDPIGLGGGINVYLYATGNPLSYTDPEGLLGYGTGRNVGPPQNPVVVPIPCNGEWVYEEFDRQLPEITRLCFCYWLCVPCDGPAAWSGNKRDLPSTWGQLVYSKGGGSLKTGDDCLCKDRPGPETGCKTCPPKKK